MGSSANRLVGIETSTNSKVAVTPTDGLELAGSGLNNLRPSLSYEASATSSTSTSSTTMVDMGSMTLTPQAGTYSFSFGTSGEATAVGATITYQIAKNGVAVGHSLRAMRSVPDQATMSTQAIISCNGTDVITVQYKTSLGTVTVYERSLSAIRIRT